MKENISRFPKKHLIEMLHQHITHIQSINSIVLDKKIQYMDKIKMIKEIFEDEEYMAIILGSIAILDKICSDKEEISSIEAEYALHREIYTGDYEKGAQSRARYEMQTLLDKLGIDAPDED